MKILVSAYACEPDRGSEPGAGWAWSCAAAQDHEVWVLTHVTNRRTIDAALGQDSRLAQRLHPVYLENARWARRLRTRGPARVLYYAIWQFTQCRTAALRLHDQIGFDICHHLTYASDWMPAGVSRLQGVPFVWGPVGGSSTRREPRLWMLLGFRAFVSEAMRAVLLGLARSTVGRSLARRAAMVVGQNHDVASAFPSASVVIEPNIALASVSDGPRLSFSDDQERVAVYAGNLLALKGLRIALAALALPATEHWQFHIYGEGPLRRSLIRQAERLGITDRVRFFGFRPREEVRAALAHADVMLFPSTRDSAGWSVAEALAAGCPVVCLDMGGPATVVGVGDGIRISPAGDVASDLAAALERARQLTPRRNRWSVERLPAVVNSIYEKAVQRVCDEPVATR